MRKYIERILHWLAGRRNDLGSLILKVTAEVRRVLEKVKSSPVQKTIPVIVQPSPQRPIPQSSGREESIPHANISERIFQTGIVVLGICFIGLIVSGVMYLIILWVMR